MKQVIIFCMLYFSLGVGVAMAQAGITGVVTDNNGAPLAFANVLMLDALDSSFVRGSVTEEDGTFFLGHSDPGEFVLKVSMIGFKDAYSREFRFPGRGENIKMTPLQLQEDSRTLEQVVVEAERPLYEQQIDRLVVNVQNSITSTGNTALEVLQKSPGIVVNRQSNSIAMAGKSGVRIMINGKLSRLPADAVVQMLEGMSAANIDKIELITTPPAKYDAEGTAGLINIVLKENPELGTNGSIGLLAGFKAMETLGSNFNINHLGSKWSLFADYSILSDRNIHYVESYRRLETDGFEKEINTTTQRHNLRITQNASAGFELALSEKTRVNALITAYRNHWQLSAFAASTNLAAPDSTVITEMDITETNLWQGVVGSGGITHELSSHQQLSLEFDYFSYNNHNPSSYINNFFNESYLQLADSLIDVEKETPLNVKVVALDYQNQLSPGLSLEMGMKASLSTFVNEVQVSRFGGEQWIQDGELTGEADLDERIGAAYVSANWKPGPGLDIKAGLRYERTGTYLSTENQAGFIDRNYGTLAPALFLQKSLREQGKLQLSYSRRITRPTFTDMAPFVFFIDPNSFFSGNPGLWPAISDIYKTGYQYKQWVVSGQYSHTKNEIAPFQPSVNPGTNKQTFNSENLDYMKAWALSSGLPFALAPWWESQLNLSASWQLYRTKALAENVTLQAALLNLNMVNVVQLPKGFSFELSGFYQSKSVWGISTLRAFGSVNAGIQKQFRNKSGMLRLSFDDIFHQNLWNIVTEVPEANLHSVFLYDFNVQSVRLNYTHTFGKKDLSLKKNRTASEEERKRLGN